MNCLLATLSVAVTLVFSNWANASDTVPKPLYRDPVFDGAADVSIVYDRAAKLWKMFYTNRRATMKLPDPQDVAWVHGTAIGIATSEDGVHWRYQGTADFPKACTDVTSWAPDIFYENGTYHMWLTVVPGIFHGWGGPGADGRIVHLTSTDLAKWDCESTVKLDTGRMIDPTVMKLGQGYRMWYKDERAGSRILAADSRDLRTWTKVSDQPVNPTKGEGPKAFRFKGYYWLVVDVWDGLMVLRSEDALNWTEQPGYILGQPGRLPTDRFKGQHADVVVDGDRAFIYYFVHQQNEAEAAADPRWHQRTVIQVAELVYKDGKLSVDRDADLAFQLHAPSAQQPPASDVAFADPLVRQGADAARPAAGKVADKPLFRDPGMDGAADPVLVWNAQRARWWMYYTNRRARLNDPAPIAWVHGTRIGIAESADGGASWSYVGEADIELPPAMGGKEATHWAPDVVRGDDGVYHMFLTVVPGIYTNWRHPRHMVHLTSTDMRNWRKPQEIKLGSEKVIDASVVRLPGGGWRMWYNNEADKKAIWYADSPDLTTWTDKGRAVTDQAGEGPKVFPWKGSWWMVTDVWDGLGVYRSDDLLSWQRQESNLLQGAGSGVDDQVKGGHADVVVSGDRAYLFYFTHPGRRGPDQEKDGPEQRRSSIQVTELFEEGGKLNVDRDRPVKIALLPVRE